MLLTILVVLVSLAIVMSVKARFDRLPRPVRHLLVGLAALLTATALTMELFIYARERVIAFVQAVEGVPRLVVLLVFLVLLYGAFTLFQLLARVDRQQLARLFRENVTPHLRDMASDVRSAWRSRSWWRPWRRVKRSDEETGEAE
jgi:hypothetical protein